MKSNINHYRVALANFMVTALLSCPALADEIILVNEDRLTGTVKTMEGDTLTLETSYSESIRIKRSEIRRVQIDSPADIHLSGGEILKGKVRSDDEGKILIEPGFEKEASVVQWHSVASINPPTPEPSKWSGSVSIGAGLQSGNTERTSVSVSAEATRRTDIDRYSLRCLFNYAEEDDSVTARNTYGSGKYDYFFTKKYYGYLGVELMNDRYKDLKLRTVIGPGVGYQVWEDAVKFLLFEVGISYFSEDLEKGGDDDRVTGRLAGNFRYNIRQRVLFSDQLMAYPNLEDSGEYQLRNEASLSSPLASGWSLKLDHIYERDSDPPENVKEDDYQWILGLRYVF